MWHAQVKDVSIADEFLASFAPSLKTFPHFTQLFPRGIKSLGGRVRARTDRAENAFTCHRKRERGTSHANLDMLETAARMQSGIKGNGRAGINMSTCICITNGPPRRASMRVQGYIITRFAVGARLAREQVLSLPDCTCLCNANVATWKHSARNSGSFSQRELEDFYACKEGSSVYKF